MKELKLIEMVFMALKDPEIGKTALATLHLVITKVQKGANLESLEKTKEYFMKYKTTLLNKVLPSSENQNDP